MRVSAFQNHEVCHSSAIILLFFVYYLQSYLVNKSVFQVLTFNHTTEINNYSKPQYYCLLCKIYTMLMETKNYVVCRFEM
jgi:hypothetical protein